MTRVSWDEGQRMAEAEAWRRHGAEHKNWYIYRRFIPLGAVAALVGLVGWLAYQGWLAVSGVLVGATSVPGWVWLAGPALLAATVVAVRGNNLMRGSGTKVFLAVFFGAAWLFLVAAALGML